MVVSGESYPMHINRTGFTWIIKGVCATKPGKCFLFQKQNVENSEYLTENVQTPVGGSSLLDFHHLFIFALFILCFSFFQTIVKSSK